MGRIRVGLLAVVWSGVCVGQQGVRPEPVGQITGVVTCSDTQRPARLAQVKLVRVPDAAVGKAGDAGAMDGDALPTGNAVESGLDGSYTVRNVKPGRYWVVADKDGYLIPLGQFSKKELTATDDSTRRRVAQALATVEVQANQTAKMDIVLDRGASVSGTVSYDDGTPASGIGIELLAKDKDGKWQRFESDRYRTFRSVGSTDDNGHYRIRGLPGGEYATQADLSLSDHESTLAPMPGNPGQMVSFEMTKTRYSLPIYSGDVLRKQAAAGYTLGSGEARAGGDLVFPLAKLHKVGGQLVAKDGHLINAGGVKVVWADDKSEMTEAAVSHEDAAFHLDFVPEGDFVLQVSGAKDVTRTQVENPAGVMPRFHEESKTVKTYGDAEQALKVIGDVSDVLVVVPEAGKSGTP